VNGPALGISATTLALFDVVYTVNTAYFRFVKSFSTKNGLLILFVLKRLQYKSSLLYSTYNVIEYMNIEVYVHKFFSEY